MPWWREIIGGGQSHQRYLADTNAIRFVLWAPHNSVIDVARVVHGWFRFHGSAPNGYSDDWEAFVRWLHSLEDSNVAISRAPEEGWKFEFIKEQNVPKFLQIFEYTISLFAFHSFAVKMRLRRLNSMITWVASTNRRLNCFFFLKFKLNWGSCFKPPYIATTSQTTNRWILSQNGLSG